MKSAKIKSKLKKHAPELIVGVTTIVGTVGWILAGIARRELEDLREYKDSVIEYDPFEHLAVGAEQLRAVREEGAVLRHWIGDDDTRFYVTNEKSKEENEADAKAAFKDM